MATEHTEQRKLAAIMFTDMVGYTALAQHDEALALDLLEEHRQLLRSIFPSYHGHEIETTGDGFLVEFSSALEATRCALEIQEQVAKRNSLASAQKRIFLRVGIHVGDVVQKEGHILGDGVNIAARIEPLAEPGSICISEAVARLIEGKINAQLVFRGRVELKNVQRPLEIYSVVLRRRMEADGLSASGSVRSELGAVEGPQPEAKSVAVLPFVNISSDRENEYLSDGITEDLITALSKIRGLRVPARTSSFAFKGKNEDIRKIGQLLNVITALEGSVRKVGNRIRISAQLVNVADGYHLWSERYDREMEDVFAIQDEITRAIVNALKVQLVGEPDEPLVKPQTASAQAYQLYLKGRECWYERGLGLKKALRYFELALLEDPNYALAYSGLADTYNLLGFYGYLAPEEIIPKTRAAAARALQIDPELAETRLSCAANNMWYDWDFEASEQSFRKAIALNPNYALAHIWFGILLSSLERHGEAVAEARRGLDLDRLSPYAHSLVGWLLSHTDEYEEAVLAFRTALELSPNYVLAHWLLGQALVAQSRLAEGILSLKKADELTAASAWVRGYLAHAYAANGQTESALALLSELEDSRKQPYVRSLLLAMVHAGLGEKEKTFQLLDQAFVERDVWLCWIRGNYVFDTLHNDARFTDLLRKIGLQK